MTDNEQRGLRDPFTGASAYNQLEFIIERKIREMINTSALVRVDGCTSAGPEAPAGTVSATPLVSQTDADGNALPMASIPRMPHARVQGGVAALIIDPVPGDIGVASFCKADSSTVRPGTTRPQRPGSFRCFDQADGMLVATVSNRAPEVWIELKQDKTVVIHAPEGVIVETDKSVTVTAAQDITLKAGTEILLDAPLTRITGELFTGGEGGANVTMTGNISLRGDITQQGSHTSTGDQVAGGISQTGHTHTGVQPGNSSTGKPQ
ncbi:MAG: phage baseplate assembly protein [Desulfovibrionaceae bacterium]|nr:phage baseplate assembly protein [Desulfovibrionaceae bacterium]